MAGLITNSNALICTELEFKVSEINVTSAFYHSQWINFLTNINKRKSFLLLPEEGAVPEKLGGGAGPFHKTLTLFMTKICHFCYPIYDHTKKIRYSIYDYCGWQNCPKLKLWRAFLDSLIDNNEKVASSTKYTQFKTRAQKPCPIYDKNGQNPPNRIDILFMTKTTKKPYPLGAAHT